MESDLEHRSTQGSAAGALCQSAGHDTVEPDRFKSAMRKLTSAVTVITVCHERQLAGLTATSVSSLSLQPPSLLVCISKSASAHDLLLSAGRFCVNIMAAAATDVADLFADKARTRDRFATIPWTLGASGVPVLEQAVAHFECRLVRTVDGFSHTVLIGVVVGADNSDGMPLLYEAGRYGAFHTL